ncbi:MAG: 5-methyltetrahydropteroyltriglutamate--homocysteine S-methyltransferase [Alphaproteobacteria bacterium]
MANPKKPPFRADHVGSLLRPRSLRTARDALSKGAFSREALREVEDRAIRDAVRMQESVGLQSITDGEFRRAIWHVDFLTGFAGIEATQSDYAIGFRGDDGRSEGTASMMVVKEKVRRLRAIALDHFRFLYSITARTPKQCIPSPTFLHLRGGRKLIDPIVYPDPAVFWEDIIHAYRLEIADLMEAGLTYLQLDDVSFAVLCDEAVRAQVRADGEDPDALPKRYVDIINRIAAEWPGLTITLHTCRGNHKSMWMASGGYDAVAETVFGGANVDGFFLEYDTERAGGFEPLRFVAPGKKVVLGLVSTKRAQLESKDELKRRIEEASKYVPLERLCLSPQCGFASSHFGNQLTEDDQKRKLALVVETANEVWGQ